jgi:hypothetical protein
MVERINGRILGWGLNWALIKTIASRKIINLVTNTPSAVKIKLNTMIDGWQYLRPENGYAVAKVGRTTGWTTGKINTIGSIVRIRDNYFLVVPVEFKREERKFDDVALVFGILADDGIVAFIAPGDSGSVVLHNEEEGMALGLGFAGNSATFLSYMMPMGHVIRDIESITGAKVVNFPNRGTLEGKDLAKHRILER